MPRFIIAGSVVGLGLVAIAAFIVGWFGLTSTVTALSFAFPGVIVMVYVWDHYAMLYDLPGRDMHKAVVDMKEVETRASSLLALEGAAQLCGLRYVEGKQLWIGHSHALWFVFVVAAMLCLSISAVSMIHNGVWSNQAWILIAIAALCILLAIRFYSGHHRIHCLNLGEKTFVREDGSQLRLSDAWVKVCNIDDDLSGPDSKRHYEVVLCWPEKSLELVLFILPHEIDAKKYAARMVQLTGAHHAKER
ncbi:hypothetical protein D8Y20_00655 [Mariprofundus sp. EBB-1]|uniref:hypothetical protein n=1 Tax=Mariprofundus sp. EBB-1 TaxID=2650971 RepID=UPI000EF1C89A|nr:hypothetical protein [Mariprofundus sp. EBB-1]RLL55984.1 hypothetical protein D8Y20_00655 [Mariprofundus sp. EBB-1]